MKRKFFGGRNDSRLANDFVLLFQERDYAPTETVQSIMDGIIYIRFEPLIFGESSFIVPDTISSSI